MSWSINTPRRRGEENGLLRLCAMKLDAVINAVTKYFGIIREKTSRREQRYADAACGQLSAAAVLCTDDTSDWRKKR